MSTLLRQHAEQQFAEELRTEKNETNPIPENWRCHPNPWSPTSWEGY